MENPWVRLAVAGRIGKTRGRGLHVGYSIWVGEITTQELALLFQNALRGVDEAKMRLRLLGDRAMQKIRNLRLLICRTGFRAVAGIALACLVAAPASAQPLGGTAAGIAQDGDYRINIGDELEVLVWGEERMQRNVRVQPDGSFAFPLAGTILAAGMSTQDVRAELQRQLADKYRNGAPDVTVTVREAAGMRFFVVGKVRTPGSYAASGEIDVLQALSMAGGLAEFADVKGAVVLRKTPQGQVVERVKLAQVLKGSRRLDSGALAQPLPVLRSGDVLVIP